MKEGFDKSYSLSPEEQKDLLVHLLSREDDDVYPLSLAQQGLWFLDQLEPGNVAYNVPLGLRLRGRLKLEALRCSVRQMVRRHAILRTRFRGDGGIPIQVVRSDGSIEIPILDLTHGVAGNSELEAYRAAIEEIRTPFNLATGPLLRLRLIRLDAEEHILICVMHHIICDGWSLGIFIRELAAFYEHFDSEVPCGLADLPIQYGDYAVWQREWCSDQLIEDQLRYWRHTLAGAPTCLELPADHPRPEQQTFDGASYAIAVSRQVVLDLTAMASSRQTTIFMVMLATFKLLIHCYTGVEDIVVGVPAATRSRVELEDLIGFFVNTLVLRTRLSGTLRFGELLLQTRDVSIAAFTHADLPFERLVEALNPPRDLNRNPVFQIMFSHLKVGGKPQFGGGLISTPYPVSAGASPFDLSMNFIEEAGGDWWLRAEYDTALFKQERIIRLLNDYATLLATVAVQPDLPVSELASRLGPTAGAVSQALHPASFISGRSSPPQSPSHVDPRDTQQQILVRIWERVLGASNIGIHDDFFNLGGHSLLAARLISEVQSALGCRVPLSALFRHSTIATFSEVIREGKTWTPDPVLMEIQGGRGNPPIFGVAAPGVDTLGYALLVRHMDPDQPFYKLQVYAPTFSDLPYSAEALRELAREYIQAMRALHPEGPYFLGATCGGVHIAEQMVLQLEAAGQTVGLLTIIDTWVLQNRQIRWLERLHYYSRQARRLARMPRSAQFSFLRHWTQKRFSVLTHRVKKTRDPWVEVYWPGKGFQPQRFDAPVLLFKRPRQPYFCVNDPELGWGQRSRRPVEICTVDASHEAMLREPSVQLIAHRWQNTMRRITGTHSGDEGQSKDTLAATVGRFA